MSWPLPIGKTALILFFGERSNLLPGPQLTPNFRCSAFFQVASTGWNCDSLTPTGAKREAERRMSIPVGLDGVMVVPGHAQARRMYDRAQEDAARRPALPWARVLALERRRASA